MTEHSPATDGKLIHDVIAKLENLSEDGRQRILQTVATYYGLTAPGQQPPAYDAYQPATRQQAPDNAPRFSNHSDLDPKQFLREKHPTTDVERVACLAYYLSHYRQMPQFKTIDISLLNTEAAQPKFSNTSVAISNALRTGYIAEAGRGHKQISAAGEHFVLALPDREAAKQSMEKARTKRKKRTAATKKK